MERPLAIGPPESARSFGDVAELMRIQAKTPPGNDPCIGSCYECLVSLIDTDEEIGDFFARIYQERSSLTPAHAVNLTFRSIQHIQLNLKSDRSYLDFETSEQWRPLLVELMAPDNRKLLEELLLIKDTITTVYQRYAGPKAIISSYWNGDPVNVADFGCGANVGLPGIELNVPFEAITDETPDQLVLSENRKPLNIQVGLAIDKYNPEDPDVKMWSIACSHYPKELRELKGDNELASRFKGSRNTAFLQADLLSQQAPHMIPKNEFDAVILSTVLYQRTPTERETIITEAYKAIKSTGIIIIQDFARKDPVNSQALLFNGAWGGGEFGYRTFILRKYPNADLLEALRWSDGRCRTVKPGEDFNVLQQER